jgi:hypothetical protein
MIIMNMKSIVLVGCLAFPISWACAADAVPAPAVAKEGFSGKVIETMSTAGYTYVQVDTGSNKVWAAAVQFAIKMGDQVYIAAGNPMPNYHSKSLNRDFELVYFTDRITVNGGDAPASSPSSVLPPGHPALPGQAAGSKPDPITVQRADGGKTVQEIITAQSELAGKPVMVRGKVVRYNAMILGKNWLHIRDGSGSADKNDHDLTVTTLTPVKPGDTVLVTGNVTTNKDFGAGYKYAVILDDAKVTVE